MIVQHVDATTTYMDREALAQWASVSQMTVRRHCREVIVGVDEKTGRVLYDCQPARVKLDAVKARPERRLDRSA